MSTTEQQVFATLEEERAYLVEKVQSIQVQLSDQDRTDPDTGERLSDMDYHEWRRRALGAHKHALTKLRDVTRQIKERNAGEDTRGGQLARIEEKLDLLLSFHNIEVEELGDPVVVGDQDA